MELRTRNLFIWASIFVAAFLISLIIFLARPDRTDQYVLFFPSETTDEWIGEARTIHHTRDIEESVKALLLELSLGPITLRLEPALPKGTGVRSVLVRDKQAYLDFSAHLAVPDSAFQVPFPEMLSGLKRSVLYNFPGIEKVIIYVEGVPTDISPVSTFSVRSKG